MPFSPLGEFSSARFLEERNLVYLQATPGMGIFPGARLPALRPSCVTDQFHWSEILLY